MSLDPYKVLGVAKDTSANDVKKAYYKLAQKYHPDKNPGDKVAEEKFKEISSAYDILSDPQKKSAYDNLGKDAFFQRGPDGQGYHGPDFSQGVPPQFSEIFENLFGQGFTFRTGTSQTRNPFEDFFLNTQRGHGKRNKRESARGQDLEYSLTLDFLQAVKGARITINIDLPSICSKCEGTGYLTSGRGFKACPKCHGNGKILEPEEIVVTIPVGATDGQRLRVKGKGAPGENGGTPGDLFLLVHVAQDANFRRDGNNLLVEKKISLYRALLGGSIEMETLTGRTSLKVPAGTQNGAKLRLQGKGIAPTKGKAGDMIVTLKVVLPTRLSPEAKNLVQELEELAPMD
ncbi:MAG: J domain-containing protein [Deltaproteobacteria bacterium]|jgi:molecular chaperone DnaJ|nr:J domain-containing protein [Deltaproteobacteria bacterium]